MGYLDQKSNFEMEHDTFYCRFGFFGKKLEIFVPNIFFFFFFLNA